MRHLWVDYARAIGIVLVVYGHVSRGLFNAHISMNKSTYMVIDSIIYSFHMPLFFFLSGLFFYETLFKKGWLGLFASKIDSLVYPYILWSFLQGAVEVLLSKWTTRHETTSDLFSQLLAPDTQLWFLYALFFVFIAAIIVYPKEKTRYLLIITIASSMIFVFKINSTFLPLGYVLGNFCFFALGVFFKDKIQDHIYDKRHILFVPSLAIFAGAQYVFHGIYGLNYTIGGAPIFALAIASIAFIVILCMCMEHQRMHFVSLIGSSSMAIFLAHILVGSGARIILVKALHVDGYYSNLTFECILGVLLPILAFKNASRVGLSFIFSAPSKLSVERLYNKNKRPLLTH